MVGTLQDYLGGEWSITIIIFTLYKETTDERTTSPLDEELLLRVLHAREVQEHCMRRESKYPPVFLWKQQLHTESDSKCLL